MGLSRSQHMQQSPPPPGERRSEKKTKKQQKYRNSYRSDDGHSPVPLRHADTQRRTLTAAEVHTPRRKPGKPIFLADIVPGLGQSDVSEALYLLTRHLFRVATVAPCFRGFARLTFVLDIFAPPAQTKKPKKNTHMRTISDER